MYLIILPTAAWWVKELSHTSYKLTCNNRGTKIGQFSRMHVDATYKILCCMMKKLMWTWPRTFWNMFKIISTFCYSPIPTCVLLCCTFVIRQKVRISMLYIDLRKRRLTYAFPVSTQTIDVSYLQVSCERILWAATILEVFYDCCMNIPVMSVFVYSIYDSNNKSTFPKPGSVPSFSGSFARFQEN